MRARSDTEHVKESVDISRRNDAHSISRTISSLKNHTAGALSKVLTGAYSMSSR